jgi:hypothetical protein
MDMPNDRGAVWALVAEVVDAVEAELDVLVASIEDRIMARMQASNGGPSAALHEALRRGVSAGVREALARLRSQAEPPRELPPDLMELGRLCAGSRCELAGLPDTWLVGEEVFWDHFQVVTEQTLADTALCWEVIKAARVRLTGNPARLTGLFRRAFEREFERDTGIDEDSVCGRCCARLTASESTPVSSATTSLFITSRSSRTHRRYWMRWRAAPSGSCSGCRLATAGSGGGSADGPGFPRTTSTR